MNNFRQICMGLALMLSALMALAANSQAQDDVMPLSESRRASIKKACKNQPNTSEVMCQCVMERVLSRQSLQDLAFIMHHMDHPDPDVEIPEHYGKLVDESNEVCFNKLAANASPKIKHVKGVDAEVLKEAQDICTSSGYPAKLCKCAVNTAVGDMNTAEKKRLSTVLKGENDQQFEEKFIQSMTDSVGTCLAHSHYR